MSKRPKGQDFIDRLYDKMTAADAKSAKSNGHGTRSDLSDEQIIERCRRARNSEKFSMLFDVGDVSAYRHDDSKADFALLGILKQHTRDHDQLERLMRRSALVRAKWDENRGGRSWLRYSIANAVASPASPPYIGRDAGDATEDGPPLTLERFSELATPGAREFIVAGLIPRFYPTTLYGWGSSAKSLLAAMLALRVAGNCPTFFGRELQVHGPTLLLDFELDGLEQRRRVAQLCAGINLEEIPDDFLYISALGHRTPEAVDFALAQCEAENVVLVVLDSLGPAMIGDMGAAKDVIGFHNAFVRPFQAMGGTVVLVDHQSRQQPGESYQSKGAFGSSYKEHLSRSLIQVERGDQGSDDDTLNIRLRHKKANFGRLLDPFDVRLSFSDEMIVAERRNLVASEKAKETTLNATERVVAALEDGPAYSDEIAETTGLALKTVKNKITALKKAEGVEATGQMRGQYEQVRLASPASPTTKGRDAGEDDPRESDEGAMF